MTAIEPQFRDFDIPQFVFLNNNKKSCNGRSNVYDTFSYKSQPNGKNSRCTSNKPVNNNSYLPRHNLQSYNKNYYNQSSEDYNFDQFTPSYAKLNTKQIDNSNWISYASTASESDSGSHISSELTGFKIVQSGSVVHDETEEDFESSSEKSTSKTTENKVKYASSLMVMGPDAKEISLPSFA